MKRGGINLVALLLVLACLWKLATGGTAASGSGRVNPAGLAILLAGLVAEFCAGPIARKLRPGAADGLRDGVKLAALAVCAAGALLAMV